MVSITELSNLRSCHFMLNVFPYEQEDVKNKNLNYLFNIDTSVMYKYIRTVGKEFV